jgi:hypothetical protein
MRAVFAVFSPDAPKPIQAIADEYDGRKSLVIFYFRERYGEIAVGGYNASAAKGAELRTCLSLLIIVGHLVAQAAALHVHADDSHVEQASLPHVHLSWFGDVPAQHAVGQHGHDVAAADETASTVSEPTSHDSDAVFVAAVTIASQTASQLRSLPLLTWDLSAVFFDSSPSNCCILAEYQNVGTGCCADAPRYHCALFLQLQTLRI